MDTSILTVLFGMIKNVLIFIALASFLWATIYFKAKPYQALYLFFQDLRKIDPDRFPKYGFWLYAGLMGSGKTVSMTEYIYRMKEQYPKLHVAGNFTHGLIDETFETWQELLKIKNPIDVKYGVLIAFDEIHLTFESGSWKSAPDNLLEYISMARKNHKQIIATSQVFNRVNKKLREQTNYVIECKTVFNRWTFNKAFLTQDYAVNNEQGDSGMRKRSRAWRYNFVQTNKIRDLFDSYELLTDIETGAKKTISIDDLIEVVSNAQE